jgi:hypothetical protein
MKLLTYSSLALAYSSMALKTEDFTIDNIMSLQNSLQNRARQEKQNLIIEAVQTQELKQQIFESYNRSTRDVSNKFNDELESCEITSKQLWNECKSCISQQCTAYYENQCTSKSMTKTQKSNMAQEINNGQSDNSNSLTDLEKMVENFNSLNSNLFIKLVFDEESDSYGIQATIRPWTNNLRKKRSTNVNKNNRSKRSDDDCGFATVRCEGSNCGNIEFQPTYEITCGSDEWPDQLNMFPPHLTVTKFTNSIDWSVSAASNADFELQSQEVDGQQTMVLIDLNGPSQEKEETTDIEIDIINDTEDENGEFDPAEYFDLTDNPDINSSALTEDDLLKLFEQIEEKNGRTDSGLFDAITNNEDLNTGLDSLDSNEDPPCEDEGQAILERLNEDRFDGKDVNNILGQTVGGSKLETILDTNNLENLTTEQFCNLVYNGKCPDPVTVKRSTQLLKFLQQRRKRSVPSRKSKATVQKDHLR